MQNRVAPSAFARLAASQHVGGIHQLLPCHTRFVVRALRTVRAILRATAGLDRKQAAELHFLGAMKFAVRDLRLKDQLGEGKPVDLPYFISRPVVAHSHRR